ncbi:MAG: hypothetical protein K2N99_02045, partial [Malacoplasma sp.]|nr:hypothetical protein [Malacoplasma sp.]
MNKKLKILFSFGVIAAAAGSGIAPTMITKTSVQSSAVNGDYQQDPNNPGDQTNPDNPGDQTNPDNPGDQTNPDNPGDQTNPDNPGDQQDPESKISYAPETDIFTYQIIFVEKQDNEGLDKVLRSLFADKSLLNSESKYLLNVNEYENVKLTYVENSANFSEKTFNISVTPINEGKWEDGKSDSKIVVTKLSNLKLLADAQVPISAKITNNVTGNFASDKDLEDYLVKNYGSLKFAAESGTNFTNTLNEYVQNSANLKDKTFRIKVWPQEQHSWKDGTGNGVKEMLVNIPNLTQQSSTPIPISPQVVRAPIFWTVNSTILSNYKETWNGWKWTKSYLIFGLNASENDWILQTIFENAMKD